MLLVSPTKLKLQMPASTEFARIWAKLKYKQRRSPMRIVVALLLTLSCGLIQAQEWRKEPLSVIDQRYMSNQQDSLDSIARSELGRQFNGEANNDLAILQALLDQKLVSSDQRELLQGMGIILGNLVKQKEGLLWVAYTDKYGRSRALEIPGTDEFLFPITMISRRAEVGIQVNVRDIYNRALQIVDEIRKAPPF